MNVKWFVSCRSRVGLGVDCGCVGILAEANVFRVVLRQIYGVVGWR